MDKLMFADIDQDELTEIDGGLVVFTLITSVVVMFVVSDLSNSYSNGYNDVITSRPSNK